MSIFTIITMAILATVIWAIFKAVSGLFYRGKTMVCTTCEHVGPAKNHTRGHLAIEVLLWLAFLVPGLIYSIWRLTTRAQVCSMCGSDQLVPPESPAGRRIVANGSAQQASA